MQSPRKNSRVVDLRAQAKRTQTQKPIARAPRIEREGQGSRVSPLRAKRRRVRTVVAVVLFLLIALIAVAVHFLSYHQALTIQSIDVQGAHEVSPESVREIVERDLATQGFRYIARANIFVIPREEIERDIRAALPRVSEVSVVRESITSTTLRVTIVERQPFGRWCDESENCYAIDEKGFIFSDIASLSSGFTTDYVFSGGIASTSPIIGQIFAPGHMPGVVTLLSNLTQDAHPTTGARIFDDQDFIVYLQGGYYLKASFGQNPNTLVRDLDLVLNSASLQGKETELEYIDLRFGNRVYYKMKGEEQAPAQQ